MHWKFPLAAALVAFLALPNDAFAFGGLSGGFGGFHGGVGGGFGRGGLGHPGFGLRGTGRFRGGVFSRRRFGPFGVGYGYGPFGVYDAPSDDYLSSGVTPGLSLEDVMALEVYRENRRRLFPTGSSGPKFVHAP